MFTVQLAVFLAAFTAVAATDCTYENFQKCAEPVNFAPDVTDAKSTVPSRTEAELKIICDTFYDQRQLDACLSSIKQNCSELAQNVREVRTRNAYYKYFCKDNGTEYRQHRECSDKPSLQEEGRNCHGTFQNIVDSEKDKKKLCQAVNTYVDCVWKKANDTCEPEDAMWLRGLLVASSRARFNYIACHIPDDPLTSTAQRMLFSSALWLLTLFIVTALRTPNNG